MVTAAALGGGGLGVLGGALYGLMKLQVALARKVIGAATMAPPSADGIYGAELPGTPLRLLVLGDSAAAGYGLDSALDTPPALLASGLSHIAGRPVLVRSTAKVGARSSDLSRQLDAGLEHRPDVAVVVVGANDVTHTVLPSESILQLQAAVRRLRECDVAFVVGTCPDLGTVQPVAQPLRLLARLWSRRLAAAQTIVAVEAGGRSVSLGALLGPSFSLAPTELFGPDRFHPSEAGYASLAAALLPTVAAAVGVWDDDDGEVAEWEPERGSSLLPVSFAAARAVIEDGTEVAATDVAGRDRGGPGRWALLRHRSQPPLPAAVEPEPTSA